MTRALIIIISVGLLALSGCKASSGAADLNALDLKTSMEPETKIAAALLPTPEEYEAEAAKKITVDNMESELEAVEEEMAYLMRDDDNVQPEEASKPKPKPGDPVPLKPGTEAK